MIAHTISLFNFAGINAQLIFSDFDNCIGHVQAEGFDAGGMYESANIAAYCSSFASPAQRDQAIADAMKFVAREMQKQADWQSM